MIGLGVNLFISRLQSRRLPAEIQAFIARVEADGGTIDETKQLVQLWKAIQGTSPTLALSASAYKAEKIYSLIPDTGAGDFTVSQPSPNLTRINKNGQIEEMPANTLAPDYSTGEAGWYVSGEMTNLFRDSEPAVDPEQGTRTNVTFAANDWGIGLAGKVVFDTENNCLYHNTDVIAADTIVTVWAIIKSLDGNPPTDTDLRGGTPDNLFATTFTHWKNNFWILKSVGTRSSDMYAGVRTSSTLTNRVFEVSAIMVVEGNVDLTLSDYIKTTGSSETRDAVVVSPIDLTGIKTLILNDFALIAPDGFAYDSYEWERNRPIHRIATFDRVLSEAELASMGAAEIASADAVAGDMFVHDGYIYGVVESNGELWLDRNLGAKRVAQAFNDDESYGDLYQWGRATEGHEKRDSAIHDGEEDGLATTAVPDDGNDWDGKFITNGAGDQDWLTPKDDTLWQGVAGTNNPSPDGWRIPTETEMETERLSWSSNDSAGAFSSALKLPVAGFRFRSSGSLVSVGSYGYYWSATVNGLFARYLVFYSGNAGMANGRRANGFSVRCIKS